MSVNESPKIQAKSKNSIIHQFSNTGNNRHEFVAYQEYADWFFSLVLSAPSQDELLNKQDAFVELIGSFKPMLKNP